jgi:hypothetical protein
MQKECGIYYQTTTKTIIINAVLGKVDDGNSE